MKRSTGPDLETLEERVAIARAHLSEVTQALRQMNKEGVDPQQTLALRMALDGAKGDTDRAVLVADDLRSDFDTLGIHEFMEDASPILHLLVNSGVYAVRDTGLFGLPATITMEVGPIRESDRLQQGSITIQNPQSSRTSSLLWAGMGVRRHIYFIAIEEGGTPVYEWHCTCGWDDCGSMIR